MTNRVILGKRGSKYGLWVSKPGVDVLTGSEDQMMLSTEAQSFQIVASGTISFPGVGGETSISIPNLGFEPLVLVSCMSHYVAYRIVSNTSIRIRGFVQRPSLSWTSGAAPVNYAVTNQPLYH